MPKLPYETAPVRVSLPVDVIAKLDELAAKSTSIRTGRVLVLTQLIQMGHAQEQSTGWYLHLAQRDALAVENHQLKEQMEEVRAVAGEATEILGGI